MARLRRFTFFNAVLMGLFAVGASVSSCGGNAQASARAGAAITVVDSDGSTLPQSAARLEPTNNGYSVYALSTRVAGFKLRFDNSLRVTQVHRGEYFNSGDLFLSASPHSGMVDVGGYRFNDTSLPAGGLLVARVALDGYGQLQRTLSALPTDSGCVARGFGYTDNGDGSATFNWSFNNAGDYNQDGEVNISDITPIGVAFGKKSSDANWAQNSLADGDGNGEVNISDLTPIGVNYGTLVTGYKLEHASAKDGTYAEQTTVDLAAGTKSPALHFTYRDSAPVSGEWYRVRAYAVSDPAIGAATDPLHITILPPGDAPTPDFTFAPTSPLVGDTVQFTDASTGSPTSWNWGFGDGATSSFQNPGHNYANAGTFTVTLSAGNSFGTRLASYQITVTAQPVPDNPADTFVDQATATLNQAGTQFSIHSTDLPDGTSILFGPLTQGQPPVDNNLNITYPYRGGLNEAASPHPDIHTALGTIGMTVAGMVIYGASNASTITVNGTKWTYDANKARINGEDDYGGHASQVNGGQYHYHDVSFISHNSWVAVPGFNGSYSHADGHSKLIGWAEDGYPIYGPYGYVDPQDAGSGVTLMTPSWQANDTGANRPADVTSTTASADNNGKYMVLVSDPGNLGINPGMRITSINGVAPDPELYVTNQQNITYQGGGHPPYQGPANGVELNRAVTVAAGATVKFEFLPGIFIEDNQYVGGGTLDRYNGRYCVTPDYPNGTYAYFCTMTPDGDGLYPYMIGPELYGSLSAGSTPGQGYVKPAD